MFIYLANQFLLKHPEVFDFKTVILYSLTIENYMNKENLDKANETVNIFIY